MKKKKIIIRIIAIVLVVMMVGGIIAAVASTRADELDSSVVVSEIDQTISAEDANAITLTNEPVAATSIAKGGNGVIYVADSEKNCIYSMTKEGELKLVCGARGISGNADGVAKNARFGEIFSICTYKKGIAITDVANNNVKYFDGSWVTTIAGSGKAKSVDGKGKKASFNNPCGITADGKKLYVTERATGKIRVIDGKRNVTTLNVYKNTAANKKLLTKIDNARVKKQNKVVKTLTKKQAKLTMVEPTSALFNKGSLYIADSGNHRIVEIGANGLAKVIAGSTVEDFVDAKGVAARFSSPSGLAIKGNTLYVADTGNSSVRAINLKNTKVSTFVEGYTLNNGLSTVSPRGLTVIDGKLYIGDLLTKEVLRSK